MPGFSQGIMTTAMKQIFEDSKSTVTLSRVTRESSNITGSGEETYANGTDVSLIFFKTEDRFQFIKEGLLKVGDFLAFDKAGNLGIAFHDKITVDNETFLVKKVLVWKSRGLAIYDAITGVRT